MAPKSATWVRGLATVSRNTMRVSGRSAAFTFATSVTSTSVKAMPCSARVLNRLVVLPNRKRLATTWSPARSSDPKVWPMAAMPVAKQIEPVPCSSRLILASSAAEVGLPERP
jgi:hypothetical protein